MLWWSAGIVALVLLTVVFYPTVKDQGEILQEALKQMPDALKSARGNRARAARLLQTTERILNYKVRKYAIDFQRFRT